MFICCSASFKNLVIWAQLSKVGVGLTGLFSTLQNFKFGCNAVTLIPVVCLREIFQESPSHRWLCTNLTVKEQHYLLTCHFLSSSNFISCFLPARRYASAGNSDRNVSVRLSVRLSRAGIVSKRRKLAS